MFIFRRLKINHKSHEFILDSGTVANNSELFSVHIVNYANFSASLDISYLSKRTSSSVSSGLTGFVRILNIFQFKTSASHQLQYRNTVASLAFSLKLQYCSDSCNQHFAIKSCNIRLFCCKANSWFAHRKLNPLLELLYSR